MSEAITDTNNQPLLYINLQLEENTDSAVVACLIPCASGKYLTASISSLAQVFARRTGSGDAFVNLATSPISLAPFAGQIVSYDFRVHTLSVTGLQRVALPVRVGYL